MTNTVLGLDELSCAAQITLRSVTNIIRRYMRNPNLWRNPTSDAKRTQEPKFFSFILQAIIVTYAPAGLPTLRC
jgi:hypothetical protein